ncbi:undecaprenyldiphospho-muramoylpentapeptide beta-N-acetylglucosaminyltransferase [Thalassospira lucentensis]|uniref:UDP-N-acetylglucosamine--N-acetylmuramyl-(pentapeptide) pyrophosphoryl-undecaprenol N-acetylglucosamine transferase n=1 Tax=Thalassospira lucentensis TaxID=168935 RepID=A0A358HMG2_9PROT|nr:undecaprenyldiphospho-muramoylpentapeptide beta-N-acetylglucosaminyltransferase [Thalassospira lucentensis]HBU96347.1 undecaprenyldiphospho-muramoylpentapeptide beta-N-acetylglucosaminyltransferase [Thalassospira lucentensis]HCW65917.1 undecaprenyldiphospho-muramoylpentapeptide beta-N-acetylglucosaminyltransferase [Thalassospira lucentensis]
MTKLTQPDISTTNDAPLAGQVIAVTSGGTGGHMFPAVALSKALVRRGAKVLFFTDARAARYTDGVDGVQTIILPAGGIAGKGIKGRLMGAARLGLGTLKARSMIKKAKPAVVIGFGGYASIPATMSAKWLGIPFAIHEQNAVLGRANRLVAGAAKRIATSFPTVTLIDPTDQNKVIWTGNPVRAEVAALANSTYDVPTEDGPIKLLITGGSQGARVLSEILPTALVNLPEGIRTRLVVTQQARDEDINAVRKTYDGSGIDVTLASFIDDIPERLRDCHLVIARSGASTVAELTAAGRPGLLVPLPHAIDDHQRFNAQQVEDAGGAWLMPQDRFSSETVTDRLAKLLRNPAALTRAAKAAKTAGRANAAERLADMVLDMLGLNPAGTPDAENISKKDQGDTQ